MLMAALVCWACAAGVLALALIGCGDSSITGGPLPPDLAARYASVEQCTGLTAPAPTISWADTKPCPKSRRECCIVGYDGFASAYYADSGLIVAHPDKIAECGDPIRFEMVRHVLCRNSIGDACSTETDFSDPRWGCS